LVDDILMALAPGVFVAVYLSNYKKMPVIGKVVEVLEEEFTIHYWKGSYAKPWEPHLLKNGREITPWSSDVLPKQSIIICDFHLDSENKLLENTRKYLKRWYQEERART
jgi:hypothetical protein